MAVCGRLLGGRRPRYGRDTTQNETDEPADTHQLSYWPPADRVIRQSSRTATDWNGWAGSLQA